jgi:hypothetical protein
MFFQPFVKELAGNLDRKNVTIDFKRLNRFKPSFETLRAYVVSDNIQTTFPDPVVCFLHSCTLQRKGFTRYCECVCSLTVPKIIIKGHAANFFQQKTFDIRPPALIFCGEKNFNSCES